MKTSEYRFKEVVKGSNFMTPEVIRYGQQGDYVYELSRGSGFYGKPVYGVTVVDLRTDEHRNDLSESFASLQEATDYINDLEKQS
jgi:hypothetical protein